MKRYYSILLSIVAISQCLAFGEIAIFPRSLEAKENYPDNSSETFFVCTTETSVPTLYAYTLGTTSLTPLISWYKEYLLPQQSGNEICQQVASKLQYLSQEQDLSQEQGQRYIAIEEKEEHTLVCMVKVANETCHSDYSEPLFEINPNYDARCILDRREPLECVSVGRVRGVFSIPETPYQPIWWLW